MSTDELNTQAGATIYQNLKVGGVGFWQGNAPLPLNEAGMPLSCSVQS